MLYGGMLSALRRDAECNSRALLCGLHFVRALCLRNKLDANSR